MKKIFAIIAAVVMAFSVAAQDVNSETVITKPGFWDNNYVELTVGATTPMKINRHNLTVYPQINLYAGHWFTPVWGVEFNGEMNMWDSFKTRDCFVSSSYVGVAGTVNLCNLFAGYNGTPRVCEVVPFVGLGWMHSYTRGTGDTNDLATKMGVDVRFNINKHWSVDIRPTVLYNLTAGNQIQYNINHARLGAEVGVTYAIGKHFVQKEVVDYAAWAALNDEVNALRARQPETVYVTNTVVQQVTNTVAEVVSTPTNVGFTINSARINYTQMAAIARVAEAMKDNENLTALVQGYADKNTGTPQYNMNLSERRAQAVKDALVDMGVEASRITVQAEGSCTQVYTENDWNRAAVITVR